MEGPNQPSKVQRFEIRSGYRMYIDEQVAIHMPNVSMVRTNCKKKHNRCKHVPRVVVAAVAGVITQASMLSEIMIVFFSTRS